MLLELVSSICLLPVDESCFSRGAAYSVLAAAAMRTQNQEKLLATLLFGENDRKGEQLYSSHLANILRFTTETNFLDGQQLESRPAKPGISSKLLPS